MRNTQTSIQKKNTAIYACVLYGPEDATVPSNSVSPSHGKDARVHVRMYVHTHTFFRHVHRLTSKSQASWLHSPHPSTSSAEITGKCHQFGRGGVGAGESPFQFLSIPSKLLRVSVCVCYPSPKPVSTSNQRPCLLTEGLQESRHPGFCFLNFLLCIKNALSFQSQDRDLVFVP